jgi:hypothetical protein
MQQVLISIEHVIHVSNMGSIVPITYINLTQLYNKEDIAYKTLSKLGNLIKSFVLLSMA